jgi:hypothetical protein
MARLQQLRAMVADARRHREECLKVSRKAAKVLMKADARLARAIWKLAQAELRQKR